MVVEQPSDEDIRRKAVAALAGDRSARDDIVRYATAIAWPIICEDVKAADRDDVLQHVLIDVNRVIGKLTGETAGSQTGFIRLVAERRTIDWNRRKTREQRVSRELAETSEDSISARAPPAEHTLENNELVQIIRSRVSPEDRKMIDLFLAGLNNAEIAERLGVHPATVAHHFKAIAKEHRDLFEATAKVNKDLGQGSPATEQEDEPPSG